MSEQNVIPDERGNRPSASMLHRIYACPNSWLLEQQCPSETPSETAERGTKIHHALEIEDPSELTDEENELYSDCMDIVLNGFLYKVLPTQDAIYETDREVRMWSKSALYSGKADVIFTWEDASSGETVKVAAIADYKTGNIPAEPVEENKQLQALAALYWQNNKQDDTEKWKIYAAIIQPLCTHSPRILELDTQDLLEISKENDEVCKRAVTGEGGSEEDGYCLTTHGCRYCRAKSICPAMRKKIDQLSAFNYEALTNEQKEDAFIYGNIAKTAIDELMAKIKEEVIQAHDSSSENPFPKLKYRKGVTRATIQNTKAAIDKIEAFVKPLQAEGDNSSMLDYVTISKASIEKFAKSVLSSEANKKDFVAKLMEELDKDGLFAYSITSPSVVIDYRK